MKKHCILAVFYCLSYLAAAQSPVEKGLESINRTSAEAYIGFLAHDELQGREAGYHGSKIAAQYIASLLQAMGIQPVGDSYFQPFEAYRRERHCLGNALCATRHFQYPTEQRAQSDQEYDSDRKSVV